MGISNRDLMSLSGIGSSLRFMKFIESIPHENILIEVLFITKIYMNYITYYDSKY